MLNVRNPPLADFQSSAPQAVGVSDPLRDLSDGRPRPFAMDRRTRKADVLTGLAVGAALVIGYPQATLSGRWEVRFASGRLSPHVGVGVSMGQQG